MFEDRRPNLGPMTADEDVVGRFIKDGRLVVMPSKRAKLRLVLDHLAQDFEPGTTYPEPAVNDVLAGYHDDYAALRRYLVDEGFLTREGGVYWRTGGTVEV
jgi:hypothetical protein